MNSKKGIKEKIKNIITNSNIDTPTFGNLYIDEGSVKLETNGVPYLIKISAKNSNAITPSLNFAFRFRIKQNTINIINLFGNKFDEILFTYNTNMYIYNCEIITYEGKTINVNIYDKLLKENINYQETKFEDDTNILRFEKQVSRGNIPYVKRNKKLSRALISNNGTFIEPEILDKDQLSNRMIINDKTKKTRQISFLRGKSQLGRSYKPISSAPSTPRKRIPKNIKGRY